MYLSSKCGGCSHEPAGGDDLIDDEAGLEGGEIEASSRF